jgi:hypothetical protein
VNYLEDNPRRVKTLALRLLLLIVIALLLAKVGPTLADELSGGTPDPAQTTVASSSPSPSETPTPSESATSSAEPSSSPSLTPTSSPSPTGSVSPSPTPTPRALTSQSLTIRIPVSLRADPRARTLKFPKLDISGAPRILFCANSPGLILDTYQKGAAQESFNEEGLISGDMTDSLILSGPTEQVLAIINSYGGLSISSAISSAGSVAGNSALFRVIAISDPTVEPRLCNSGASENIRTTQIVPLDISLDLKKGTVTLAK